MKENMRRNDGHELLASITTTAGVLLSFLFFSRSPSKLNNTIKN